MYIYLLFSLKYKEKRDYLKSVIRPFGKFSGKIASVLLVGQSLLKIFCSFLAVWLIQDLLKGSSLSGVVPYIILALIYITGQDYQHFSENFYRKSSFYFLAAAKTRLTFFSRGIFSLNLVSLLFKLDSLFPLIFFVISRLGFLGGFYVSVILTVVVLEGSWKLATTLSSLRTSPLKQYVLKIFFLLIACFVTVKIYELTVLAVESFKQLLSGRNYNIVNRLLEVKLQNWWNNLLHLDFPILNWLFSPAILGTVIAIILWGRVVQLYQSVDRLYKNLPADYYTDDRNSLKFRWLEELRVAPTIVYLKELAKNKGLSLGNLIFNQLETLVFYFVLTLIMQGISNQSLLIFIITLGFIIANSNMVHSFVVKNDTIFRNYYDLDKLLYWKLSKYTIIDLYQFKLNIITSVLRIPTLVQIVLSYGISLLFLDNIVSASILHLILFLFFPRILRFNSELSTFMVPYLFSKNYPLFKRGLSSEFDLNFYNRVYNFYKLPLVFCFLIPLIIQLFIDYFNYPVSIVLILVSVAYIFYLKKEMRLLLAKGGKLYEELSL